MENENQIARRVCQMFMKTDRLHRKAFEVLVSRLGIHRSQHMMLMHLAKNEGIAQKTIAKHMQISEAAVAVSIKKLEASGYIEKNSNEKDGRCNDIKITQLGCEIVNASEKFFAEIDSTMIKGISDGMLQNFVLCLEMMQTNLYELCEEAKEETN